MTTLTKCQVKGLETALAHAKNDDLLAAQKVTLDLILTAHASQKAILYKWFNAIADSMDSDAFRDFGTFRYLPLDVQLKAIVRVMNAKGVTS